MEKKSKYWPVLTLVIMAGLILTSCKTVAEEVGFFILF